MFYEFINTNVCNIADDTTTCLCDKDLPSVLRNLEYDTKSALTWFEVNYMKLNEGKCHFMLSGNTPEVLWTKVGEKVIWESSDEKLLGLVMDKKLSFNRHLSILCKKVSGKVSALARMVKILPFDKKRLLLKFFIESQFSYCPLIWMFCSREMNRKINHIHERALRLVYDDYVTSFEDLLIKDKSVRIHHQNVQKVAIEMCKVKNNLSPAFIKNLFCEIRTRTRSDASFHRINVNTVYYGEQSLRSFGPIVWDTMVPNNLKITNLAVLKRKLTYGFPTTVYADYARTISLT